ncbi:hypothetical protein BY458DRAFT_448840 [Sporodiniella umbellata]|nr:hypothetical protein BY458DRAFT_448840 [Sporodiniella umbellata]
MDNHTVHNQKESVLNSDTLSIDSFSSEEHELVLGKRLEEDCIDMFSSQDTHSDIGDFQPVNNKRQKTTEKNAEEFDLLQDNITLDEFSFDMNVSEDQSFDSSIEDFNSTQEERLHVPNQTQGSQIPHFTSTSQPVIPLPKTPAYLRHSYVERNNQKYIDFKKGGIAEKAIALEIRQKKAFDTWEHDVNALMAKYGSIVKVCSKSPGSQAFRLIESWVERGLVFSWCVPLKESEILQITSISAQNSFASWSENTQDTIEDFSQSQPLPPYQPEDNDQRFLMVFSFAYVSTKISREVFVQKESCVGIWPPWSESELDISGQRHKVYLITRFKSDVIYS